MTPARAFFGKRPLLSLLAVLVLGALRSAGAQGLPPAPSVPIPKPIPLYAGTPPGALGSAEADRPRLYPFLPAQRSSRAAVLIFPGGGYSRVSLGHEGFQYALWLNAQGVAAFVLDYRVAPYRFPVEIADGVAAMRLIRSHASDYGIDPDRIGVWGSSAGGHLAAVLSTECKVADTPGLAGVDCLPNFAILAYPVISMEAPFTHAGSRDALFGPNPDPARLQQLSPELAVTTAAPPTFLWATTGDPVVPASNTVARYAALAAKGVPVEAHLFDFADHGCGLCGPIPALQGWPMLLRSWMVRRNLLPPDAPPPPPPSENMPDWPAGIDGPGHAS